MADYTFKCLCEGVEYQITGDLSPVVHCHCSICRRWQGSAFRTRATVKKDQFKFVKGEELISRFQSSENLTRAFCKVCGSKLHSEYKEKPDLVGVPIAGLEGDFSELKHQGHIFVDSKADWYEILDDVPQFSGWPE